MSTPIFDQLYRVYEKDGRLDDCAALTLRRMSPVLHKCVHGGLRGFCRGKV